MIAIEQPHLDALITSKRTDWTYADLIAALEADGLPVYTVYRNGEKLARFCSDVEAMDFAQNYWCNHETDLTETGDDVVIRTQFGEKIAY